MKRKFVAIVLGKKVEIEAINPEKRMSNPSKKKRGLDLSIIISQFERDHGHQLRSMFSVLPFLKVSDEENNEEHPEPRRRNPIELVRETKINGMVRGLEAAIQEMDDLQRASGHKDYVTKKIKEVSRDEESPYAAFENSKIIKAMLEKFNVINFKTRDDDSLQEGVISMASDIAYSILCHSTGENSTDEFKTFEESLSLLESRMHDEDHAHLFVEGCLEYMKEDYASSYNYNVCLKCIRSALLARIRFIEIYEFADLQPEESPYSKRSTYRFDKPTRAGFELLSARSILGATETRIWT